MVYQVSRARLKCVIILKCSVLKLSLACVGYFVLTLRTCRQDEAVRNHFPFIICILAATVLYSTIVAGVRAQTAETLPQVKKVYVTSLGGKQGAAELRDKLILRLKKYPGIEVVGSSSGADAILTGTGETWLTGYINTSPKPSPYSRQPIYDGYLSVELHGKGGAVLWSFVAKPSKFQWNDVPQDLVNRTAKNLLVAVHQVSGSPR